MRSLLANFEALRASAAMPVSVDDHVHLAHLDDQQQCRNTVI